MTLKPKRFDQTNLHSKNNSYKYLSNQMNCKVTALNKLKTDSCSTHILIMSTAQSVEVNIVTDCALLTRFCNGDEAQASQLYARVHKRKVGYVVMLLVEADQWVAFGPSPGKLYTVKIVGTDNYAALVRSLHKWHYEYSCLLLHSVEKPKLQARHLLKEIKKQVGDKEIDITFMELGVNTCVTCTPDQLIKIMEHAVNFLAPAPIADCMPLYRQARLRMDPLE